MAAAASTVATHAFLVSTMNARVTNELSHEIAEFKVLAARNSAAGRGDVRDDNGRPRVIPAHVTVLSLMRARMAAAVLEQDTVLIGIAGSRIVATSSNFAASRGPAPSVVAAWSAITRPVISGTVQMASGPAQYSAIPVQVAGSPTRGVFVAAVLTGQQQAGIDNVTRLQIEVGAIALMLGSALAWLVAGRVLRPVRQTTALAQRITETDLSERIPSRGHSETSALAVTFNGMLDRLQSALATQRSFLADAGHELRTPITVIQGNLDTLTAATPEDAETLSIVADEISRMSRLVDELLLLASSERPDFLRLEATDVGQLTRSLLSKARTLDDRPWVLTGSADCTAVLDPQRITQAVMQLAANAVAHTPSGSPVEIGSIISSGMLEFTVADRGPGIPRAARQRVFARFARLDQRRTTGLGLGLSIVAAIAAAQGGSVRIEDRDGGGATFSLVLPLQEAIAGQRPGVPVQRPVPAISQEMP